MSFTSWQYVFFLPLVMLLYWPLPRLGRMGVLLVASYVFYGSWDVRFLALLMASTGVDFYCARSMGGIRHGKGAILLTTFAPLIWLGAAKAFFGVESSVASFSVAAIFPLVFLAFHEWLWSSDAEKRKRAFMWLSILSNLAVLGFFKYFGFFADSLVSLLRVLGMEPSWTLPNIILPVAVSFYTFQSVAYAVEVAKGKVTAKADLLTFAAYLAFFPQLVAGPIEKPSRFMPQFLEPAVWNWSHLHQGARLLLIGAFKKVFVADNCAILANYVFDPGHAINAPWALLGIVAFAFQIYGDFSGYTDLARGSAKMLGITLSTNFRFPYHATGPSDFWQRWHITLSTWFRDHVYIPLGGNRVSSARTVVNLWITMLLAGLWHGASWTFVLWGAYHAAVLTLYRMVPPLERLEMAPAARGLRHSGAVALMFAFTLIGWVIFRAHTLGEIGSWFEALTHWSATSVSWVKPLRWLLFHILPLLLLQWATKSSLDEAELSQMSWQKRGLIYLLLFLAVASSVSKEQEFIYFQF